ncbi:MAG: DUF58 domain-containing protein [Anaerolineae bacterium]|nr:DUF58 domain-containing protein [Anaerolineae bacterium]
MGNFVFFILILFVIAALLRIDFFFTIVYLFVGIYFVSHFWSLRVLGRLETTRTLQQRAFWGDKINVVLKFKNRSRLPIPWLMLHEVYPLTLCSPSFFRKVITLPGQETHTVEYMLSARKRGYYLIGPLTLHTGDLLGIRRELSHHLPADYLIVYPRIVPIAQLVLPTHSPQVILPTPLPLFLDPARPIGVRNYIPGDNPRHIHWTASAATGQMLVKQFQPAIARNNAIFLNLCRDDYAVRGYPGIAIELAIIVAASLANHIAVHEELPVGLATTGLDPLAEKQQQFNIPPRKGRGHLMQILDVLARVQPIEAESYFLENIRQEAVRLSWGTTIIIITSHQSEELSQTLLLLKRSGFRVTLVLVDPTRSYRQVAEDPAQDLALPKFKIRREKDIEVWLPMV